MTTHAESEALRMQRVPGIVFGGSPEHREPWIAGTGIDVAEIIAAYRALDNDMARLRSTFDWLTEQQVQAAFAYYAAFPAEIDERVAATAAFSLDTLRAEFPQTRLPTRL